MLRKTKNDISFDLFTMPETPDKVAEVQKIDNRASEGNLRTTSSQSISDSFFGGGDLTRDADIAEKVSKAMDNERRSNPDHLAKISEEQKSRSLSGFNPMTSNGSSIISADSGDITDTGGSGKQLKMPISNSIFDPWSNAREASKIGEKTEKQVVSERIATNRRTSEQERMDSLVDILQNQGQTNGSAVHRTGTGNVESTDFKASRNNMSIFDSSDFERIPEKTAGERISEEVSKKKAEVDSSWRGNGKSLKSSEVQSNFFDSLMENM